VWPYRSKFGPFHFAIVDGLDVSEWQPSTVSVAPKGNWLSTGAAMVCTLQCELDPLDLEMVERAIEGTSEVMKTCCSKVGLETDEGLEIALRRELAEMVRSSDVGDAEVLLECLIDGMRAR
jgi:hypothetical protein